MVLHFKRKVIRKQFLFLGILWSLYGLFLIYDNYSNSTLKALDGLMFIIGLAYLSTYLWYLTIGYVTLTDYYIKKNDFLGRKVLLSDINSCKIWHGEFKFKNSGKDFAINYDSLDEGSKEYLKAYIEQHQITII